MTDANMTDASLKGATHATEGNGTVNQGARKKRKQSSESANEANKVEKVGPKGGPTLTVSEALKDPTQMSNKQTKALRQHFGSYGKGGKGAQASYPSPKGGKGKGGWQQPYGNGKGSGTGQEYPSRWCEHCQMPGHSIPLIAGFHPDLADTAERGAKEAAKVVTVKAVGSLMFHVTMIRGRSILLSLCDSV